MSYYLDHHYTGPSPALPDATARPAYAAVVGTVESGTEKPITGRSGDHLQFEVQIKAGTAYQVDINTQSSDGSAIQVYVDTDPSLTPTGSDPNQPFGPPSYGVISNAQLSYAGLGLTNAEFASISADAIEQQLETALQASSFVAIYGLTFDDGPGELGIHETHYNPDWANQDGAIAIYSVDASNQPARTWFFFKFDNEQIG